MDTDVIHTANRFYQLGRECSAEADYLVEHFKAGHVTLSAYDEIATLTSASLVAEYAGDDMISNGADENMLDAADILAEEIQRLISRIKPWRVFLDNLHRVTRP